MNDQEKVIIKSLNKIGVDTRFISLYKEKILINNLKFSKFSRKKEEEFKNQYPQYDVIRSKLLQKICIKASRTLKNQIKPRTTLYIEDDGSLENIMLYIILEPYKRKYGIKITDSQEENSIKVSNKSLDDYTEEYITQMIRGEKIVEHPAQNTIYPLTHVSHLWLEDFLKDTNIEYTKKRSYDDNTTKEIISFLEEHIPNVKESIKQSVNYLEENNQ